MISIFFLVRHFNCYLIFSRILTLVHCRAKEITRVVFDGSGSYKCRAGWESDDRPRLIFKNVVAKQRSKKVQSTASNSIVNMYVRAIDCHCLDKFISL